jgi:hypothetical protein
VGGLWYQKEAADIVDYNLFQVPGTDEWFRGPAFARTRGQYISFVGAAQTFGTYARYPFPAILSERLPAPSINLGIGGAGPGRFLRDPALIEIVNGGSCAVIQVMSGRSAENSRYEVLDGCSAIRLRGTSDKFEFAEYVWKELFASLDNDQVNRLVRETQDDWVSKYVDLLEKIRVPKVLVWISRRPIDAYPTDHQEGLKEFPHFVEPWMLDAIRSRCEAFCDATSSRGSPQVLSNRHTGLPTDVIRPEIRFRYQSGYPSPEMHEDIANALFPILRRMTPRLL